MTFFFLKTGCDGIKSFTMSQDLYIYLILPQYRYLYFLINERRKTIKNISEADSETKIKGQVGYLGGRETLAGMR